MNFVGIDPGLTGGIARIWGSHRTTADSLEGLDDKELWQLVSRYVEGNTTVVMEELFARPFQDVTSTQKLAECYGKLQGMVAAAGSDLILAIPQVWLPAVGISIDKPKKLSYDQRKRRNLKVAQELFPNVRVTAHTADAILIAEASRRMYLASQE